MIILLPEVFSFILPFGTGLLHLPHVMKDHILAEGGQTTVHSDIHILMQGLKFSWPPHVRGSCKYIE
jgi:hypothetical protein